MNFRIMDEVMVLDGDFNTQIKCYLGTAELKQLRFEMKALATNRFAVYRTHMDFLHAGCRIIRTNTYRASIKSIIEHLQISPSESMHLITVAVQLAQKAVYKHYEETGGDISDVESFASGRAKVAGTCGSYAVGNYGEISSNLPYWDFMPVHSLIGWHRSRIQILLNAGVDILAFESIPCMKEAKALIELLREFPQARAWITFFCPNGQELMDGRNFQDVAVECYHILPTQIIAIGVHCHKPTLVTSAIAGINDHIYPHGDIPLIVYSDKWFLNFDTKKREFKREYNSIVEHIPEWLASGVHYIGGATGVNADDMEIICNAANKYYVLLRNTAVVANAHSLQNKSKM